MNITIVTIADLLKSDWSKSAITRAMKRFECSRNDDVVRFAHRSAVNNELNGATRTYLVVDEDLLRDGEIEVVAFVSVAITSTDYTRVELDQRRTILGNVPGVWVANSFPGYLIAELARGDGYPSEVVSGKDLISFAEQRIQEAMALVGGGLVYLDCRDELKSYYEELEYEEIYTDELTGLHKMMKRLEQ